MFSRRKFIFGSAFAALAPLLGSAQARDLPELTPVRVGEYTEIPDPDTLEPYRGEDVFDDLRNNHSAMEGVLFDVSGTIRHRWIAREGQGYETGYEGDIFRSLVWVESDTGHKAFLASNTDLAVLEDSRTFSATGSYGGIYEFSLGGIWEVPLILVNEINPGGSN